MAYVRWGQGSRPHHPYDSDVYIFDHIDGGLECCGCRLRDGEPYRAPDAESMVAHVGEHVAAGHAVPGFVVPSLLGGARQPDATLAELLSADPGGLIATYDADVPPGRRFDLGWVRYIDPCGLTTPDGQ